MSRLNGVGQGKSVDDVYCGQVGVVERGEEVRASSSEVVVEEVPEGIEKKSRSSTHVEKTPVGPVR